MRHAHVTALLALALLAACGDPVRHGTEGGPCFPDGRCEPGLVCDDGVCRVDLPDDGEPGTPDGGDADLDGDAAADDGGAGDDGGSPGDDGGAGDDGPAGDDGGPACEIAIDPGPHPWDHLYEGLDDLQGQELELALLQIVDGHVSLGYDNARRVMFESVDNHDGRVQCVYTGEWVETTGIPPNEVMNTEHTWCQSWGADSEPARSDLNHLFPAMAEANSHRGNYHFGDVVDATWTSGGCAVGTDASFRWVFEPRDEHKGDCARAMFYFALRYQMEIQAFEEDVLRAWNCLDQPDEKEARRNDAIEARQQTRNPFVDRPDLVERIDDF
ncbi:MAG: endonuclease [Deltaproteobacteria bacterium]|nr:endonuclease [Deltaproteobacteria bacterium]